MQPNNISTSFNRVLLDLEDLIYAYYMMLSRDEGGTSLYPRVHRTSWLSEVSTAVGRLSAPTHNTPLAENNRLDRAAVRPGYAGKTCTCEMSQQWVHLELDLGFNRS